MNLAKYNKCETLSNGDVRTCWFRGAFMSVREFQQELDKTKTPYRYAVTMLFPKSGVDLDALKQLCVAAAKKKWGDKIPKGLDMPFRDGDTKIAEAEDSGEKGWDGYKGSIIAKATTKFEIPIVDLARKPIEVPAPNRPDPIYSGAYYRAVISAWAYDVNGNRGISLNIQYLQKLADGEPFSTGKRLSAEDAFGDDDDGESAVEETTDKMDWMF